MTLTQGAFMLLTLVTKIESDEPAFLSYRYAKAACADCWATLSEAGG
jgi:hypothetical protein